MSLSDYYTGVIGVLDGLFPGKAIAESGLKSQIVKLDEKLDQLRNRRDLDHKFRQMIWLPAFQSDCEGSLKDLWQSGIESYLGEISQLATTTMEEIDRQSHELPYFAKRGTRPPHEVIATLQEQGLSMQEIAQLGWYSVPALNPLDRRIPNRELVANGQVDAFSLMESYLGQPTLVQTLRTMDVGNGCGNHCDTCYIDSQYISRIFGYGSLERLFYDERFLEMLQPDSLRIGSSGDIVDHQSPAAVVGMILQATQPLEDKRQVDGNHHTIKVFTNYRPIHSEKLDSLIELAMQHQDRLRLTISLPFNRTDTVNRKFTEYVQSRGDFFREGYEIDESGLLVPSSLRTTASNFGVQDVRQTYWLFTCGRVLSDALRKGRVEQSNVRKLDDPETASNRGLVKTYLNPDGLWLMVYTTSHESHTHRAFTPITADNLSDLSQLPYHPDFTTPPNWPGSAGKTKSKDEAELLCAVMKHSGRKSMPRTIVR